jgi:hypothetical protein
LKIRDKESHPQLLMDVWMDRWINGEERKAEKLKVSSGEHRKEEEGEGEEQI